jgi:hypothetical protein
VHIRRRSLQFKPGHRLLSAGYLWYKGYSDDIAASHDSLPAEAEI